MRTPHPDTTADVPYIGLKSLAVMHTILFVFILLVHLKLRSLTGS